MLILGIVLLLMTFGLRGASVNRQVRSKLLLSCMVFGAYAVAAALLAYAPLPPDVDRLIRTVDPLLLAFGVINVVVVLTINPWRVDRVPERFPNIVQDAIIIALFALAATLVLQEKIFATTAVGAVVVGLALQDTLGNLFAGLAIQVQKPFRVGHWVTIGGRDGMVSEIAWRATKIRTKAGNFVIVPNSVLARDTITNYSEPTHETRLEVEVGVSYETPPNDVKAAIREALRDELLIVHEREPEVLVVDFSASAITYRVYVWTTDFGADERVRDAVRSHIYYAFRRHGFNIPYPVQVQIRQPRPKGEAVDRDALVEALGTVEIFASLSGPQRMKLLEASRPSLYGAGEVIVRERDEGSSMFVLSRGEAIVTLAQAQGEVARLHEGGFFGEMSLLTGEPRSATVTAATDCQLLEIPAHAFRQVMLADPTLVERVTAAVTAKRAGLESHRAMRSAAPEPADAPQTFLARARQFLRLTA